MRFGVWGSRIGVYGPQIGVWAFAVGPFWERAAPDSGYLCLQLIHLDTGHVRPVFDPLYLAIRIMFSRRVYVNNSFIAAPTSHQETFSPP